MTLKVTIRKPATAPGVPGDVLDTFEVPGDIVEVILVQDEMAFVTAEGKTLHATDL